MLKRNIAIPSLNTVLAVVSEKVIASTDSCMQKSMGWWLGRLLPALEKSAKSNPVLLKDLQNPARHFATIQTLKKQILADFKDHHPVTQTRDILKKIESDIRSRGDDTPGLTADIKVLTASLGDGYLLTNDGDTLELHLLDVLNARKQQAVSQFQDSVLVQLSRRKKGSSARNDADDRIDSKEFETFKRLGFEKQILTQLINQSNQKKAVIAHAPQKKKSTDSATMGLFERSALAQLIHHQEKKTLQRIQTNADQNTLIANNKANNRQFESALRQATTNHHTAVQNKVRRLAEEKSEKRIAQYNADLGQLAEELARLSLGHSQITDQLEWLEDHTAELQQTIEDLEKALEATHEELFTNEGLLSKTYNTFFEKKEELRKHLRETQIDIENRTVENKRSLKSEVNNAKGKAENDVADHKNNISSVIAEVTSKNIGLNDKWNPTIELINQFNDQKDAEFLDKKNNCVTIFKSQLNNIALERTNKRNQAIDVFNTRCDKPLARNKKKRLDQLNDLSNKFENTKKELNTNVNNFQRMLKGKEEIFDALKQNAMTEVKVFESAINQLE